MAKTVPTLAIGWPGTNSHWDKRLLLLLVMLPAMLLGSQTGPGAGGLALFSLFQSAGLKLVLLEIITVSIITAVLSASDTERYTNTLLSCSFLFLCITRSTAPQTKGIVSVKWLPPTEQLGLSHSTGSPSHHPVLSCHI